MVWKTKRIAGHIYHTVDGTKPKGKNLNRKESKHSHIMKHVMENVYFVLV